LTDKEKRGKINEIIEQAEEIAMASEVVMTVSRDEHERAYLLSKEKYELDIQSMITDAKREAAREGRQEGRHENSIEIAQKMRNAGKPFDEITEFTGVTPEELMASLN
jgi:predicted transposase/invertase (TIGR01784 family)